jgi:ElaB/YqjD/DUF883 family membrane-anchored ribosome-binding protein
MAIPTPAAAVMDRIKERLTPTLDTLDDKVRQGRRAIVRGQHAVEDAASAAASGIRRRPLSAVTMTALVGALVGGLIGFGLGRLTRGTK